MTILNDKQILAECDEQKMITPYAIKQVREVDGKRVISYGLSSFGYDARVADEFSIAHTDRLSVIDPKHAAASFRPTDKRDLNGDFVIPAHGFVLCRTVEYFRIPSDVLAICHAKSTYARCGLVIGVTPLEPGWHGHVTLELSNTTDIPIRVYVGEGICQFLFLRGEEPSVTYETREGGPGKYQGQIGVTVAKP